MLPCTLLSVVSSLQNCWLLNSTIQPCTNFQTDYSDFYILKIKVKVAILVPFVLQIILQRFFQLFFRGIKEYQ